jgi:transcriptional regulator with GAF, ATPase, and Fis domain
LKRESVQCLLCPEDAGVLGADAAWTTAPTPGAWDPGGADGELVGDSDPMRRLRAEIRAVAALPSTVLVSGETGVGKGLVARAIHRFSERREEPFVHADCAALSPSLIESELFGHEKGAFTGATSRRRGRLEQAGRGTLFLDEIGELDLGLQAKLLRLLQEREYEVVGGERTRRLAARVIAATNRDLRRAVDEGCFRRDLLYRLDVFRIHVPPLRERLSDLPQLIRVGLARIAARLGLPAPEPPEALRARLLAHDWPGNVRELMNQLERFAIHADAGLDGYGVEPARAARPMDPQEGERERVRAALVAAGGNVARTARRLGLPRSTLRYRIRRLELEAWIPMD